MTDNYTITGPDDATIDVAVFEADGSIGTIMLWDVTKGVTSAATLAAGSLVERDRSADTEPFATISVDDRLTITAPDGERVDADAFAAHLGEHLVQLIIASVG